ncbi:MAG: hypothetical protein CL920_01035 [Deltaproteobacteria bacterium]|nr:hypothetical protein [Deltaproteobacteria bacterium]
MNKETLQKRQIFFLLSGSMALLFAGLIAIIAIYWLTLRWAPQDPLPHKWKLQSPQHVPKRPPTSR